MHPSRQKKGFIPAATKYNIFEAKPGLNEKILKLSH
jgi:hypothetical protein